MVTMNKFKKIFGIGLIGFLCSNCGGNPSEELREIFRNPPQEARPRVWWHWENGNVTKDGIHKDLDWMHRIGIGGFHHFDASMEAENIVDHRLIYMHDDWQDAFRYAVAYADSLGMDIGIASSPGWSCTGGPWVEKADAMKKLVWSTTEVSEGEFSGPLPTPESRLDFYRDIAVVAIRVPVRDDSIRSVRVLNAPTHSTWANKRPNEKVCVEASDDGHTFRTVARVPSSICGVQTVNIPPTKARVIRLTHPDKELNYTLYTSSRVEHAEEKAGFCAPYDLAKYPTRTAPGETFPEAEGTVNLTDRMDADGNLCWTVPQGRWRILRFGYTLTGKKNGPAPAEATGLEVDKLDTAAFARYYHHYLNMYARVTAPLFGQRGIQYLLMDSYEAQWQTWTERMAQEFENRRGYPLLPWLPALSGEILGSAEQTEQFLLDWRTTISELYSQNYAQVPRLASEYGLKGVYMESQENGRVYVVDGMDAKRYASVPMAACWMPVPVHTSHSTIPMAIADMRESASVAHLYGQRQVAAESFTANGFQRAAYSYTPSNLKEVADTELASGVNQFFIHESSHQPDDVHRPGLGLLIFGQWFTRHETWAEQAGAWIDYLARSSAMLMQGRNIADILVYYGEDTNITARYGTHNFQAPAGFNFDFVNPSGLFELTVRDGRIVAPSGASYAVLCIDTGNCPVTRRITDRIAELQASGATVCTRQELETTVGTLSADVITDPDIRFVHRQSAQHIYWINKPSRDYRTVTLSLRATGGTPEVWDPVTGNMTPVAYKQEGGRTIVTLDMVPDDAQFVVLTQGEGSGRAYVPQQSEPLLSLDRGWQITWGDSITQSTDTLRSFTEYDNPAIRYFSGTATYRKTFQLDEQSGTVRLDLGRVADLAQVTVNGTDCGILWKEPYRTDITTALQPGDNEIIVRVTNPWMNRLIGDEQPDCPRRTTFASTNFFEADSPLAPAGLLGPVQLTRIK